MATTAYNAAVAYNAPIRYDGITSDVTPPDTSPVDLFGPPIRRQPDPDLRRYIEVTHTTTRWWSIELEASYVGNDDELILLDLI